MSIFILHSIVVEDYRDFGRPFSLLWIALYPACGFVVLRNLRNATCVI